MDKQDGADPAFPIQTTGSMFPVHHGVTIRDYFAAKAMQGMIVNCFKNGGKDIAIAAYGMADYMLEERKK